MLVLSRKPGEAITIDRDITVTVLSVTGKRVRLGFHAPKQVPILRKELQEVFEKSPVVVDLDPRGAHFSDQHVSCF